MLDVAQNPGKDYYNLQHLCISVHPRHLCSGLSEAVCVLLTYEPSCVTKLTRDTPEATEEKRKNS